MYSSKGAFKWFSHEALNLEATQTSSVMSTGKMDKKMLDEINNTKTKRNKKICTFSLPQK
jgi:hypothetical protein